VVFDAAFDAAKQSGSTRNMAAILRPQAVNRQGVSARR
jgi:hypothetical protein